MKYLKTYKLFEGIETNMDVSNRGWDSLDKLPDTLIKLDCNFNNLTSLPELPKTLKMLYCYNNHLTSLPELPKSLIRLECHRNELTSLPELPKTLKRLECDNNNLIILPKLPESLEKFYCYENPLECLIPEKFIGDQKTFENSRKWMDNYYYPMINSYEGQKKILSHNSSNIIELKKQAKLDPRIIEEFDVAKQAEWS
jgi:Leucine-rich repeat (LRR) protein